MCIAGFTAVYFKRSKVTYWTNVQTGPVSLKIYHRHHLVHSQSNIRHPGTICFGNAKTYNFTSCGCIPSSRWVGCIFVPKMTMAPWFHIFTMGHPPNGWTAKEPTKKKKETLGLDHREPAFLVGEIVQIPPNNPQTASDMFPLLWQKHCHCLDALKITDYLSSVLDPSFCQQTRLP